MSTLMSSIAINTQRAAAPIVIPSIGVDIEVCIGPAATAGAATLIRTTDAPGFGPPLHRHLSETEVFHVLKGRYLFEVGGQRAIAEAGTTVIGHVGIPHRFTSIDTTPSEMLVLITPAFDAAAFFSELRTIMDTGIPERAALRRFGEKWGVEFLGPPLQQHGFDGALRSAFYA
jgi:quercetin dioxygenase-like cupin family protein